MSLRDNLNSPQVWREALFKFVFVWLVCILLMQLAYHLTDWYDVEAWEQFLFSFGVALGNFGMTFFYPQH